MTNSLLATIWLIQTSKSSYTLPYLLTITATITQVGYSLIQNASASGLMFRCGSLGRTMVLSLKSRAQIWEHAENSSRTFSWGPSQIYVFGERLESTRSFTQISHQLFPTYVSVARDPALFIHPPTFSYPSVCLEDKQ